MVSARRCTVDVALPRIIAHRGGVDNASKLSPEDGGFQLLQPLNPRERSWELTGSALALSWSDSPDGHSKANFSAVGSAFVH